MEAYGCHRKQTKTFSKTGCSRNRGKNIRKFFDHSSNCLVHPGGTPCLLLRHHWFPPQWLRRDKNCPQQSRNTEIIAPKQSAKIRALKVDCALPCPHSEGATREALRISPQLPSTGGFKGYPSQSATWREVGKRQNARGFVQMDPSFVLKR